MTSTKGFIAESLVEEIRDKTDIVEIVSDYVALKKAGKNFKGLCPFHPEKTPSFNVSPDKQFYHCFGCGEGGNVFRFMMKMESLAFPESVRLLASRLGITIPESVKGENHKKSERETLYDLNESARNFFSSQLWESAKSARARQYLEDRGISPSLAKRFFLGFAPDSWDSCMVYLRKKGFSQSQLEKAGIIKTNESGNKFFDRFRNRIIFPFFDSRGRVAGFGGRLLDDSGKGPKYLNSPETLVYKKGEIFYGIHQAIKGIQKAGYAVLTEGYFDLLTAFEKGIENVIANSGTALSEEQALLIKRYTKDVSLVFDSDMAGKAASERGFEILLKQGLRVKMALLPTDEDPDSFLRKEGPEAFHRILGEAKPFIHYMIDSAVEETGSASSIEIKTKIANKVLGFIRKIPSNIEKDEYINLLSDRLKISEKAVRADLLKSIAKQPVPEPRRGQNFEKANRPSLKEKCERGMVQIMVQNPDCLKKVRQAIGFDDFKNPELSGIVAILFEQHRLGNKITIDKIIELLSEGSQRSLVSAIAMDPTEYEDIDRAISDFARGMKKEEKKNKLHQLQKEKSSAAKEQDVGKFVKLKENCSALRHEINS